MGTPNWVGPPGTLVPGPQAAAGVGLGAGVGVRRLGGGGAPCRDSQLPEGADSHGCTLRSHMQCGGLSPVALLLQGAARRGHGHKEPGP